jgi:hypothetical protein
MGDDVVQSLAAGHAFSVADNFGKKHRAAYCLKFAPQKTFKGLLPFVRLNAGDKAKLAKVYRKDRNRMLCRPPRREENGSVSAKGNHKVKGFPIAVLLIAVKVQESVFDAAQL